MDDHFSLGQMFREDLIPLALEFYLDVVDQPESSDEDEDEEEEDDRSK